MFLNIDQKNPADIAAIDDHEDSLTYGELVRFCDHFGEVLSKRTLIFILSENCIGAFAGYIGALSNKIVPLIIHSHTESGRKSLAFQTLYIGKNGNDTPTLI